MLTNREAGGIISELSRNSTTKYGRVVELADSLDSGSSVHSGRAGSSPASPTKIDILRKKDVDFILPHSHGLLESASIVNAFSTYFYT